MHTHASLRAQIEGMVDAWAWNPDDRILLVLPLHHVHGIVNVTLCPLWVGATCEAPGGFDPTATWERLASGEVTVFMAVPTIYSRLLSCWDGADATTRQRWSDGASRLRLMVSGSAALPVSVLDRWATVTGHVLLERYGMTEVGMALGNTLDRRVPGHVGVPFPGVEARLVDDTGADVADGEAGELLLRGPQLFAGYWNRPEATAEAFVDGWFRTGDIAVRDPRRVPPPGAGVGRHPQDRRGEGVRPRDRGGVPHPPCDRRLRRRRTPRRGVGRPGGHGARGRGRCHRRPRRPASHGAGDRLAPAKVPTRWLVVDTLPRNAMGKVTKNAVRDLFTTSR